MAGRGILILFWERVVETEIAIEEFDNAAVYITFLYSLKTKISGIKLLFQKVFSTNIISVVQFLIFCLLITYWDTKNGIMFLLPYSKWHNFVLFSNMRMFDVNNTCCRWRKVDTNRYFGETRTNWYTNWLVLCFLRSYIRCIFLQFEMIIDFLFTKYISTHEGFSNQHKNSFQIFKGETRKNK